MNSNGWNIKSSDSARLYTRKQDVLMGIKRERERYSIDESEKIWFVFQSDSDEEEFYGFD